MRRAIRQFAEQSVQPGPVEGIYWGDQTWDEMLAGFVDLAMPVKMEPMSLVPPREKPAKAASQR